MRIHTIELQGQSLLSCKAQDQLNKLLTLSRSQVNEPVLLIQTTLSGQPNLNWYQELSTSILKDELIIRLHKLRELLWNVYSKKPAPWVYATTSHCLGDFAELALACDTILLFQPNIQIGLPELAGNFYPCGGILYLKPRLLEIFTPEVPTILSDTLVNEKLAAFCIFANSAHWQQHAKNWLHQNYHSIPQTEGSGQPYRCQSQGQVNHLTQEHPSLKALLKISSTADHAAITEMLATSLLSDGYLNWYLHQISQHAPDSLMQEKVAYIPVSDYILPSRLTTNLLKSEFKIVFVSPQIDTLLQGVEVYFHQISRCFSLEQRQIIWATQIQWAIRDESSCPLTLKFEPHNQLCIFYNGDQFIIHLLGTNPSSPHEPIAEIPQGCTLPHTVTSILHTACESSIEANPYWLASIPPSVFALSILVENFLSIAIRYNSRIEQLIEYFAQTGWEVFGGFGHLERFFSTRHASYGLYEQLKLPPNLELDRLTWDMSSLKEANTLLSEALPDRSFGWQVIQEMVSHTQHCCQLLIDHQAVDNIATAHSIVSAISNFPSHFNGPQHTPPAHAKSVYNCRTLTTP